MTKTAATVVPGDTITDGTTTAVVFAGPNRSERHAPGRVTFLARGFDGRVYTITVHDTDRLEVTR